LQLLFCIFKFDKKIIKFSILLFPTFATFSKIERWKDGNKLLKRNCKDYDRFLALFYFRKLKDKKKKVNDKIVRGKIARKETDKLNKIENEYEISSNK
jgi:hypothetical protein